jgi:hypothetical protein
MCVCWWQLDDLKWGYFELTRFNSHQVWGGVLPFYLLVQSAAKGSEAGDRKHLGGIMLHRNPIRCAISMLGLNFCWKFFVQQLVRFPLHIHL